MKQVLYIGCLLLGLNVSAKASASLQISDAANIVQVQGLVNVMHNSDNDTEFVDWTEEQYKHYEDSIYAMLYSPVIAQKADSSIFGKIQSIGKQPKLISRAVNNSYVPNSINLDKSKEVGQIPIKSGTSQSGAKTYEIPISVYPGMKGFNPNLSFTYNSQQGNSIVGVGWSVTGLPMISRSGKSIYYDGKPQGIVMDNSDAFILSGIRLIKTGSMNGYNLYESEQGNIKAKGYMTGNIMKYFEVFYPDGNKGVFGSTANSQNHLYYPLMSLADLKGNTISYSYSYSDYHYKITKISYNGASVEFQYQTRKDQLISYCGGYRIFEPQILQSVTCKLGSNILGTYTLNYSMQKSVSLLTQVGYTASGKSYNPIRIYYGEGLTATSYTKTTTQLLEWYVSDNPNMIKVAKGKFDYDSGSDGVITLPNLNPYWKHYRHSTWFRHSQKRFDNKYTGDEKIFLYAGLTDDWASPMPNLYTEKGFVEILCADIEGKQEEYVIKINNLVANNNDQVTFKVYRSNLYTGLSRLYTRTYTFPTVYKDADGGKSIQPKFYYTGDFNGDGRMEVMAVSVHQPFGDTGKPSKCYIFDLASNKILYQGHVLPYNIDFVGSQQTDPKAAANNTDKLLVMDYDGDGKTDICHINEKGVNIYTFDVSGSTLTSRKVATYTGINKASLSNRDVLLGEFNGDGLMDLLVSPSSVSGGGYTWNIFNSKGNGFFDNSSFSGTFKSSADNTGFIIQDINGDGITDLIKYSTSGFFTYLAKTNNVGSSSSYSSYPSTKSILIPTNLNTRNCFTQMISIKDGVATKYAFPRNDSKEMMATGMANSLGLIEKNDYRLINEEGVAYGLYSKGYGAVYPFVNIQEPIAVVASSETFMNGIQVDYTNLSYTNAVIHRQGLGFRGFEKINKYDKRGQSLEQTFEPYRFNLLKSEVSSEFEKKYTYSISTQSNKIAKIRLTNKVEKDLLKGVTATSSYVYDSYGYPTNETTSYTGNISISKVNSYSSKTAVGDGYNLGFLINQRVTVTRDGSSYAEQLVIPAQSSRQANVKIYIKDGNTVKQETFTYDSHGNPTLTTLKEYSSPNIQKTNYTYDTYGRLSKVTSTMGLTNEYTYDTYGRVRNIKDHKGGMTNFTYDEFGREINVSNPDRSNKTTQYAWTSVGASGLYSITQFNTGKPTTTSIYDALNREVRSSEIRFDGTARYVDKVYDSYGNLQKTSLPFTGKTASLWNSYSYDSHNRILSSTESSGRKTTYSYNGNSIITVANNISTTKNYDALGNVVSVTDPAGTITYQLAADGQPNSIEAPGSVVTSFNYDKYRRRISLTDPSQGTTSYEFDASGNVIKETNANNDIIQYEYDAFNRLTRKMTSEFSTSYTYNAHDELIAISTDNGSSKSFVYDNYGRLSICKENGVDNIWLQKNYTYTNGNVSSIKYTSRYGVLATENYIYSYGHLSEANLDGAEVIYKLSKENSLGQPTEIVTGGITRKYDFTAYGLPYGRSAVGTSKNYQSFTYIFDAETCNLSSRKDNARNIIETFGYDNLNRLTSYADKSASYDEKGNIISKSDIGTLDYSLSQKPYAVSSINLSSNGIPTWNQDITYTSFWRPESIIENNYTATFTYNGDYDRVKMNISQNGSNTLTRYYLGNCYELDLTSSSSKEKLYLFGGFYDAPAVYIKDGSQGDIHYILRDYLGSITQIVASDGTLEQELSYDAWGRLRNPTTQVVYALGQEPYLLLGRGYTGHEHLSQFGLVNMNARLYDPALGRFLSPDPFVQAPDISQNFNRYSYAMNNPLYYVDENGEFFWIVVGVAAGIAAVTNVATHWKEITTVGGWQGFWKGTGYALSGALAGGVGAAAGVAAAVGIGGMMGVTAAGLASATTGFTAGATVGVANGATSGFLLNTSNSLLEGNSLGKSLENGVSGGVFGGVVGGLTGGVMGGIKAVNESRGFWNGKYSNRTLVQKAATKAENYVGGKGAVAGTKKHEYATKLLDKYEGIYRDKRELIFKDFKYDTNHRKYILDVLDTKNGIIYDWKFGYPLKTPTQLNMTPQMQNYRKLWGLPSEVIKP